jgi:hypothetical protein
MLGDTALKPWNGKGVNVMNAEEAHAVAQRLIMFLETGKAPAGLFTEDVFLDFTLPQWRLQAQGVGPVIGMRLQGHPGEGTVPRGKPSGVALH